ncbi:WapI family immunity protein [Mycetocola zhadangensis]|uniref:Uncharacterized protein n=1 Tax=Mycetocola zhadangensis TaxID=1164595 RepID=A0A3L7J1G5_9MICO|nr:hypothetical protein [Mycetocola zhadangensis]RLQ84284.1 hypothetical protein D9V28_08760 [Mycetocola zhadangensis]GGE94406.1 hypothetical protein GCM10011313_16710 [Mycetocola zhadangensis]
MELKDLSGIPRVVLHPVEYEFASAMGDAWDDNWLVIAGEVTAKEQKWSFRHPSLVIDEAIEIAEWFERVANRREAPTGLRGNGGIEPSLAFTEPNLAFSVKSYGEDTAVVRVHFSLEALPPNHRGPATDQIARYTFSVELEIPFTDALGAATTWRKELAVLPRR